MERQPGGEAVQVRDYGRSGRGNPAVDPGGNPGGNRGGDPGANPGGGPAPGGDPGAVALVALALRHRHLRQAGGRQNLHSTHVVFQTTEAAKCP